MNRPLVNNLAPVAKTPIQQFDATGLPLSHIESLRGKLTQIIDSMQSLIMTIDGDGVPGMSSWPDILSKYNNLLAQSHTLSQTLSGVHIPQPPRRPGEPHRPRVNPFQTISLHPLAAVTPGEQQLILENLLKTEPSLNVIKRGDETVRRFAVKRKDGTQDSEIIREMQLIREGHDARIDRALKSIEQLKEKYDWKMRVAFDEPDKDEDMEEDDDSVIEIDPLPVASQVTTLTQSQPPPPTDNDSDGSDMFTDDDFEDVMEQT